MRDPLVKALYYDVSSEGLVSYKNPEPLSISTGLGEFNISEGLLTVEPNEHFSNEDEARSAIDPFLRSWEIEIDLKSNIGSIRFKFQRSEIIDLDPPKPGEATSIMVGGVSISTAISARGKLIVQQSKYPSPSLNFSASPEVQIAYDRWIRFREGKEPLLSMAYYIFTHMKNAYGGINQISKTLSVSNNVLEKVSTLSSRHGDEKTARKAQENMKPLKPEEAVWLEAAIRKLIYRMGEHSSGRNLTMLTKTGILKH